jgi:asparagine synthase (glutamine-hydrolysing)
MCGIAGIWNLSGEGIDLQGLQRFTDSMSHRGPDGAGYQLLEQGTLGLGHRRLSILDLSEKGKQPMSYADERYWITFNGEVFNFLELRKELANYRYTFKTETDTEVILAAFHKWGKECLRKFNGMWALAIYDTETKVLFLSRDRYGVKPLHYTFQRGKIFAFASETIAFKYLQSFSRSINYGHLAIAIDSNNILEGLGHTLYENIFQLLPGHYIELTVNSEPKQTRWWNTLEEKVSIPKTYEEQVEQFKYLFEDACRLRLISDVPVATALSGGVDSSSVYCMINQLVNQGKTVRSHKNNKTAFCATFTGTEVDERRYAEKVIEYTKGSVKYIEPDYSNLTQNVIESTLLFDSITSTPLYSILEVYKGMKRNGYTVSLDGHGGDEILYGYTPTVFEVLMHAYETKNTTLAKETEDVYLNMFPPETIEANSKWLMSIKMQVNKQQSPFGKTKTALKKLLFNEPSHNSLFEKNNNWVIVNKHKTPEELSNSSNNYSHLNRAEKILAKDFCLLNIPYNLRDFDRAAMQTGIEIRMPLMDYRLVQYSFSLPFSAKLGKGVTKLVLRDAMNGIMPEEIRMRKNKMGFSAPVKSWLSSNMSDFVRDCVKSQSFNEMPFLNKSVFQNEFNEKFGRAETDSAFYVKLWTFINASLIIKNN